jgi:D-psicose/D-tagatose/L-ribulose 3-epimerase
MNIDERSVWDAAYSPMAHQDRRDRVVRVLKELATEAAPLGAIPGLEVCNSYEANVVNTAHDALVLADDIGADNVMVHLDSYHMNIEEDDLVSPVLELGERLGYVHIGENHRGYLGSGHLDFPAFFGALARIDYPGAVTR